MGYCHERQTGGHISFARAVVIGQEIRRNFAVCARLYLEDLVVGVVVVDEFGAVDA